MLKLYTTQYINAQKPKQTLFQRFNIWLINTGKQRVLLGFWVFLQILCFIFAFLNYRLNPVWQSTRDLLGVSFYIARGCAMTIHVNTAIILFPVCRTLISWVRTTFLNRVIPFDQNIAFHKVVGFSLIIFSLGHTFAHYRNFYILSKQDIPGQPGWFGWAFLSGPGFTGHVMLLVLIIMGLTSLGWIRRPHFNLFWYTHHLMFIFFGLFSVHGAFCLLKPDRPPYCSKDAAFWKYWIAGGVIYLCERLARELRNITGKQSEILRVVLHPGHVVEVVIRKHTRLEAKAGQYIFINCPAVSLHEWHPFTLTSSPHDDYLSVHISMAGTWTKDFAAVLGCPMKDQNKIIESAESVVESEQTKVMEPYRIPLPRVMVDGPFGSASEDVFDYEVTMMFGSGIGVTPFASVMKTIHHRFLSKNTESKLRKVYFFWLQRSTHSFEWFRDLLDEIEQDFGPEYEDNPPIEIHKFFTGKLTEDKVQNLYLNTNIDDTDALDVLTELRAKTHIGRPNLDKLFFAVRQEHPSTDVGVFFCGNPALGTNLEAACHRWSTEGKDGTRFYFNKETF
ncbi:hypothetical protein H4219_002683 [Mycoemilia scoparia]|uniref:FAD-binding FR-type domain-containing protein n=1 Tax=Mycoemilia scoparia TaxID=417184 RepID=A0A9W7ZWX6_9FUNG|nr:hypothetical protein H4219_002683 [Mycoemilia scoparia]